MDTPRHDKVTSVLFCCDHNSVRSPMAEGLAKKMLGQQIYIQSAGVKDHKDIDGFAITVCKEVDVELLRHRARSVQELEDFGETIGGFDLIIALSETSHHVAREISRPFSIDVEYWEIPDPSGTGETRDDKLMAYRNTRDELAQRIQSRFPEESKAAPANHDF